MWIKETILHNLAKKVSTLVVGDAIILVDF